MFIPSNSYDLHFLTIAIIFIQISIQFSSNESRRTLSDLIPDIAIATTAIEEFHLTRKSTDSIDNTLGLGASKRDFESERPRFV